MPNPPGYVNPQPSFGPNSYPNYGSGFQSGNRLYPDFPDGIYRDSNPAAAYGFPGPGGLLPGPGGDNFGFPFSPFGLF
jgi:hypothetical protein